jgi:hypothetical protein
MRDIPWVEVLERSGNDTVVYKEYPFPNVERGLEVLNIEDLHSAIDKISCEHTKQATSNRLFFILNQWHIKSFVRVVMKNWKYNT